MFSVKRIKHVTIIGPDQDAITERMRAIFDFGKAKPGVMERFGLINYHFPVGDSFVETLQVTDPDKAGGRFLERFGAGFYMLIFEIEDQPAALAHLEAMGARISHQRAEPGAEYRNIHLHPQTNLGPLMGLGDPVGPNAWGPGGPSWQSEVSHEVVQMFREVTLVTDDLDRMAGRYQRYFGFRPERYERLDDGGYAAWVPIGDTVLQYLQPGDKSTSAAAQALEARGPGMFEVRVQVNDLEAALARASREGVAALEREDNRGVQSALLDPAKMDGARWRLVQTDGEWPRLGI